MERGAGEPGVREFLLTPSSLLPAPRCYETNSRLRQHREKVRKDKAQHWLRSARSTCRPLSGSECQRKVRWPIDGRDDRRRAITAVVALYADESQRPKCEGGGRFLPVVASGFVSS